MPLYFRYQESAMQDQSTFVHREHESERSFDAVVTAFEAAIGSIEGHAFGSGFMLFLKLDHGAWMAKLGLRARAYLYILGSPLIARTMIEHNIGVGLNVPVRVLIYEDLNTGAGRLAYDLPSSLMARLANERVTAAAKRLDEKLSALALTATGKSA
jgi:uncharacterized protein (DUF302 family)